MGPLRTLNDLMEFDHVIVVHADGSVTDAPDGVYAPTLYDDELDDTSWTLMNGYSGQDRYAGPIMHNSEFIGGRMEIDILATPGYYVALVSSYSEDADGFDDEEGNVEGWAVAHREAPAVRLCRHNRTLVQGCMLCLGEEDWHIA